MIDLRPILFEEYPAFCEYFIEDYSREIVDNYGLTRDSAIEKAKRDLNDSFPKGPIESEHELLCIEIEEKNQKVVIGYLWHLLNTNDSSTFIYDFYVSESYRGRGIGSETISLFGNKLKSIGINQIKLRVAYYNKRALKLYQSVGFSVTGYNMAKKI